jgi:peptidoglycan hydrolase CwlO-like protein
LSVPLALALAGAGCRSDQTGESSLVEREQAAFGYSNEIRRIEALRAQYEEQKETLEILFSEMDRQSELIAKYERDIAQATGRVAALQGQLQAELEKEKALRAQLDAAKGAAAPPADAGAAPAPAGATPPAEPAPAGTPPAGGEPPK